MRSFEERERSIAAKDLAVVRKGGLEPPRACARQTLNLVRLPFRHFRFGGLFVASKVPGINFEMVLDLRPQSQRHGVVGSGSEDFTQ